MKVYINDVFKKKNNSYIKDFDEEHLFLLLVVQENYSLAREKSLFTMGMVYDIYEIENRRVQARLTEKLMELAEWGQIRIDTSGEIKKNTTIICEFIKQDSGFTVIDYSLIKRILDSEHIFSQKLKMVFTLFVIDSFRNSATSHSFPSKKTLKKELGINSNSSIESTIDNLIEIGVIIRGQMPHQTKKGYTNSVYILTDKGEYEDEMARIIESGTLDHLAVRSLPNKI